jgi:hydrogenase maturation protease
MTNVIGMSRPRILIAGIGNIFHGDDAFGVELAQRLLRRRQPDGVTVVDFGIRGFELTYALLDGADITIFLDATPRGGAPGTLYTIEIDSDVSESPESPVEAHGMNPMRVLQMVKTMGGTLNRLLLVGCEPLTLGTEEEGMMGLSPIVAAAVDRGVEIVESLISKLLRELQPYEEIIECQRLK